MTHHPWRRVAFLPMVLSLFLVPAQAAPPPDTPLSLKYVTVVTAEEAWAMVQQGVLIVDTRVAHEYVDERIRGAVSIPYGEKSPAQIDFDGRRDRFALDKLPADKSTPVIFYCNAGQCWKSYKACKAAVAAGYTRVYWLRGGIPEWKTKNLPVE